MKLKGLFCFILSSLICISVSAQIDAELESLAKKMLSVNEKNYRKLLGNHMMSKQLFDKYFKEDYKRLLGEEFEMNLPVIYEGIHQLYESYVELPKMFAGSGAKGKLMYSHTYSRQLPLEEGQKHPYLYLSFVYTDAINQAWTWDFGVTILIGKQVIINPYGNWHSFDVVHACSCFSGNEFLNRALVDGFSEECGFLKDLIVLESASTMCGVEWEEDLADASDSVDICECLKFWNEYELDMKQALEIENFAEKQAKILGINAHYGESLYWCNEKVEFLKSQDGFNGMDEIWQNCNKD